MQLGLCPRVVANLMTSMILFTLISQNALLRGSHALCDGAISSSLLLGRPGIRSMLELIQSLLPVHVQREEVVISLIIGYVGGRIYFFTRFSFLGKEGAGAVLRI